MRISLWGFGVFVLLVGSGCGGRGGSVGTPALDRPALAARYYGEDSAWYLDNTPFFECSDTVLQEVWYYRWKMYKAHLRRTGDEDWVVTEFINHVAWDREPWCTINAASMHHIHEGRWLKDDRYLNAYIDYLCQRGGNNHHYSESIADAAWSRYLVNGDSAFLLKQLDSLASAYDTWSDHYDRTKQLYWIPAMPDATEYTVASVDASGGTAGFDHGEAFRPTINSYQYANASAISRIAAWKGDGSMAREFANRANGLRERVQADLWNPSLTHFTDRLKQDNEYVHYWDPIRSRELAGLVPWYFGLPKDDSVTCSAWRHALDTSALLGRYGYRTNEPSYEHYFEQFVWYGGQRSSQWNGPSWPYQSSMVLTAMANLLQDYRRHQVSPTDYLHALRLFARQHYLPEGVLDLVENYDPDIGGPIVYYYWSNHYNHSSFNDLIVTGLCGVRPSEGDSLLVRPLGDSSIDWFALDGLSYHGHELTVKYDRDGSHYGRDKGLRVRVDGTPAGVDETGSEVIAPLGKKQKRPLKPAARDLALNISGKGYPRPSASVNNVDTTLNFAIDGRAWYFPQVHNRWTSEGSPSTEDWYAVDLGKVSELKVVTMCFVDDGKTFRLPKTFSIEIWDGSKWESVAKGEGVTIRKNTASLVSFPPVRTDRLRVVMGHPDAQVAITELEVR